MPVRQLSDGNPDGTVLGQSVMRSDLSLWRDACRRTRQRLRQCRRGNHGPDEHEPLCSPRRKQRPIITLLNAIRATLVGLGAHPVQLRDFRPNYAALRGGVCHFSRRIFHGKTLALSAAKHRFLTTAQAPEARDGPQTRPGTLSVVSRDSHKKPMAAGVPNWPRWRGHAPKPAPIEELTDAENLEALKRAELMQIATDAGIKFDMTWTKAQLKDAIIAAMKEE